MTYASTHQLCENGGAAHAVIDQETPNSDVCHCTREDVRKSFKTLSYNFVLKKKREGGRKGFLVSKHRKRILA